MKGFILYPPKKGRIFYAATWRNRRTNESNARFIIPDLLSTQGSLRTWNKGEEGGMLCHHLCGNALYRVSHLK